MEKCKKVKKCKTEEKCKNEKMKNLKKMKKNEKRGPSLLSAIAGVTVFFESVPRLFASGFPGLVCLFENQMTPSLARHNQLSYSFHNSHSILVVAFSSILVNARSLSAFCSVVRQPNHAGTNSYLLLYIPIRLFIELTFGRMPILTRRPCANTFQIVCALLSKNDTRITFCP